LQNGIAVGRCLGNRGGAVFIFNEVARKGVGRQICGKRKLGDLFNIADLTDRPSLVLLD